MIDFWPPAIFLLKISSKDFLRSNSQKIPCPPCPPCAPWIKIPCAPWIIQSALRGLHILHRQTLVFNIEFLEFTCSLKEMLSFIF